MSLAGNQEFSISSKKCGSISTFILYDCGSLLIVLQGMGTGDLLKIIYNDNMPRT